MDVTVYYTCTGSACMEKGGGHIKMEISQEEFEDWRKLQPRVEEIHGTHVQHLAPVVVTVTDIKLR